MQTENVGGSPRLTGQRLSAVGTTKPVIGLLERRQWSWEAPAVSERGGPGAAGTIGTENLVSEDRARQSPSIALEQLVVDAGVDHIAEPV